MTIKNEQTGGVSRLDLDRAGGPPPAAKSSSSNTASAVGGSAGDSIAVSASAAIRQQALTAGAASRSARVQELQQLIATNQYQVDAAALSRAIVDAHLAGD